MQHARGFASSKDSYWLVVNGGDVLSVIPRSSPHSQYTVLDCAGPEMIEHDVVRYGEDRVVISSALSASRARDQDAARRGNTHRDLSASHGTEGQAVGHAGYALGSWSRARGGDQRTRGASTDDPRAGALM